MDWLVRSLRMPQSIQVPSEIRRSLELWVGCVAGALTENDYRQKLQAARFESIEIEPTRIYKLDDAREFLAAAGLDVNSVAVQVENKFISAFVRARKLARPAHLAL